MQATDLEFDSAQRCLEAAALGHGIALGRSSFVEDYLDSKRLVALPQPDLETRGQVYLALASGLSQQAPAALFRDHLLSKRPAGPRCLGGAASAAGAVSAPLSTELSASWAAPG